MGIRWMNSHMPLSHLDGFFLRLRLGKWEEGLGGTGYYVACITGMAKILYSVPLPLSWIVDDFHIYYRNILFGWQTTCASVSQWLIKQFFLLFELTGAQMDNSPQKSKKSIGVDVGGIKCLVESQYVSNHGFLEVNKMDFDFAACCFKCSFWIYV